MRKWWSGLCNHRCAVKSHVVERELAYLSFPTLCITGQIYIVDMACGCTAVRLQVPVGLPSVTPIYVSWTARINPSSCSLPLLLLLLDNFLFFATFSSSRRQTHAHEYKERVRWSRGRPNLDSSNNNSPSLIVSGARSACLSSPPPPCSYSCRR